jgi:hypothetical protein
MPGKEELAWRQAAVFFLDFDAKAAFRARPAPCA